MYVQKEAKASTNAGMLFISFFLKEIGFLYDEEIQALTKPIIPRRTEG